MAIFRWFADMARRSNEKDFDDRYRHQQHVAAQSRAEQQYKDSLDCCANCLWYDEYSGGKLYYCSKHHFSYDMDDVKRRQIQYKKTCNDFFRK